MSNFLIALMFLLSQPNKSKYWFENQDFELRILDRKIAHSSELLTIRLENKGTMTIFLAAPLGTQDAASLMVEESVGDKWHRITVPSDVRAACSVMLDVNQSRDFSVEVLPTSRSPVMAAITIFPDRHSCVLHRNGFTFHSPVKE